VAEVAAMIAGHFGLAAAVKSGARQVPLWALMLATVWLDVVFVPLFLTGIETLEPVPGVVRSYGGNIIHADYTHSLVGALLLSALFGLAFGRRWGSRAAWVLGLVAFSHWLLDVLVHRGDMPWVPGQAPQLPKLGLGLWQFPVASMAMELLLVLAGSWLYWRAARAVATSATGMRPRADLAGLLLLLGGIAVLALDVMG
jgi:hypothetical protein